jgi:hypothetical protein
MFLAFLIDIVQIFSASGRFKSDMGLPGKILGARRKKSPLCYKSNLTFDTCCWG